MTTPQEHTSTSTRQRLLIAAVGLLLAIHAGLLAYSATRHSPTMTEPALLTAGLTHWEFGRFELYRVNPPLVRMIAALPVMAAGYNEDWSGFYESAGGRPEYGMGSDFIAANGERSIWLFTIARWACIPFSLIGGLFAFAYSRELWRSDLAGLVTLTAWCFEPNILAHAELITNDVACTAFGLGATWLFWRWLKQPTWGRAALAGLVLGLAELAKSSWLILFGLWPLLAIIWWFAQRRRKNEGDVGPSANPPLPSAPCPLVTEGEQRRPRLLHYPAAQLAGQLALSLYVVNVGYAFDGSFTRLRDFEFISRSLTGLEKSGDAGNRFRTSWLGEIRVPLPKQYVLGVDTQKHDFESWSRPSYLRGEWKQGGWWYYYLYGLWVKVPHGVHLLLLMAFAWPLWRWLDERRQRTGESPRSEPPAVGGVNESTHDSVKTCDSDGVSSSGPDASAARSGRLMPDTGPSVDPRPRDLLILLAPGVALFVLVSSQTEMNEHFRYVLPTVGTLLVLAGSAANYARRRTATS